MLKDFGAVLTTALTFPPSMTKVDSVLEVFTAVVNSDCPDGKSSKCGPVAMLFCPFQCVEETRKTSSSGELMLCVKVGQFNTSPR